MKYIKKFESLEKAKVLIPGQMYLFQINGTPVCYVGNNGAEFPILCLLLRDDNKKYYEFIDWVDRLEILDLYPLNISLEDYIIQNNIVKKTLESIKKYKFSSGPSGTDKKLTKNLYNKLMEDERIQIAINSEKYNL